MATNKANCKTKSQPKYDEEHHQPHNDSYTIFDNSDDYEAMEEDGPTKASKSNILSSDEIDEDEDDRIIAAVKNVPRFQEHTNRRVLRFHNIFERGKAELAIDEKAYGFPDEATGQLEVGSELIQCEGLRSKRTRCEEGSTKWIQRQKGSYARKNSGDGTDGTDNFRRLTKAEKAKQGDDCSCEICTSRSEFEAYVKASAEEPRSLLLRKEGGDGWEDRDRAYHNPN
ncbi:hypothetical protein O988_02840 [Pseudogymnoascus sp. VKM F-3808]|nr:hypothetical protein O988_02840 [Pseudogymnoascus sp. VKM F-3808]